MERDERDDKILLKLQKKIRNGEFNSVSIFIIKDGIVHSSNFCLDGDSLEKTECHHIVHQEELIWRFV